MGNNRRALRSWPIIICVREEICAGDGALGLASAFLLTDAWALVRRLLTVFAGIVKGRREVKERVMGVLGTR